MVIEIIGDTTNQTKAVTRELWIEGRRFSGEKKKKKINAKQNLLGPSLVKYGKLSVDFAEKEIRVLYRKKKPS